jgi:hypothetical protein
MAEMARTGRGVGRPLCEVCAQPVASGARALLVGACEFPFYVHDGCQQQFGPLAVGITRMCSAAEVQPEGLLWLGSRDAEPVPPESEV